MRDENKKQTCEEETGRWGDGLAAMPLCLVSICLFGSPSPRLRVPVSLPLIPHPSSFVTTLPSFIRMIRSPKLVASSWS